MKWTNSTGQNENLANYYTINFVRSNCDADIFEEPKMEVKQIVMMGTNFPIPS